MFRILHCSDLHLERSFAKESLPVPVAQWRRADLRATLGRILSLARERSVDVVTIAGDLYEYEYAPLDTAEFLVQQFARLAPIRVFVTPGEHDPHTSDSIYALTRWPENVRVFSQGRLSPEELAPGISLWGAACPPLRGHESLGKVRVEGEGVNLLLLHAMSATKRSGEVLFSLGDESARVAGFDFALLGHNHMGRIWPTDTPCCVYPGSPEPLAPEEANGTHQAVLLTIEGRICKTEGIPISQWRYHSQDVDLNGCESVQNAANRIQRSIESISGGDSERMIVRMTLTGLPLFDLDLRMLAEQTETKAHLHLQISFALPYDLDLIAQEQTVRGLLTRRFQVRLEAAQSPRERTKVESALHCALRALNGKQVNLDEIP